MVTSSINRIMPLVWALTCVAAVNACAPGFATVRSDAPSAGMLRWQDSTDAGEDDAEAKKCIERIALVNRNVAEGEEGRTETFRLEVAATPDEIATGLMGREEIAADGGMLFVYDRAMLRSFWMKNCLVDIDIMFLDSEGKVVKTWAMKAEPPRRAGESMTRYENRLRMYSSVRPAQFAIELRAGTIKRLDIREGDLIDAEWKRIAKLARSRIE